MASIVLTLCLLCTRIEVLLQNIVESASFCVIESAAYIPYWPIQIPQLHEPAEPAAESVRVAAKTQGAAV